MRPPKWFAILSDVRTQLPDLADDDDRGTIGALDFAIPIWATAGALVLVLVLAWLFGSVARWLLRGRAQLNTTTCMVLSILGTAVGLFVAGALDHELTVWHPTTVLLGLVSSTCGMYDGSGAWMARVGIPAKSGVSGGILGVLPGQIGLGVWSPRLDEHGNSVRGVAVFERLSRDMELHMMHVAPSGLSALRSVSERDGATVFEMQGDLRFAGAEIVASRACEEISTDAVVLDLTHVRVMDEAARGLIRELAHRLDDEHDVRIEDPDDLMETHLD